MGTTTPGSAMSMQRAGFHLRSATAVLAAVALLGVVAYMLAAVALAQEAPIRSQPEAPPPAAHEPNPNIKPGFIDAVGRWLKEGRAKFKSNMESVQETVEKLGSRARNAAKDATGAIKPLPGASVTGRARCEAAPNGAPDCRTAASALCKGKGFQDGNSVATVMEEKCPARVFLEARAPAPGECRKETYVTRAVCH
jgi:hypothetical protein